MMRNRISQLAAVAFAVGPMQASAQAPEPVCAARADLVAVLAEDHGEVTIALGITSGGIVLEILARPDGATWTALATDTTGETCIAASGTDWIAVAPGRTANHQPRRGPHHD